jgi:hypothetical protein
VHRRLTSSPARPLYSKVIGPVFEKLESSFPNIGFYKCDVDEQEVRRFARLLRFFAFLALLTLSPTSETLLRL